VVKAGLPAGPKAAAVAAVATTATYEVLPRTPNHVNHVAGRAKTPRQRAWLAEHAYHPEAPENDFTIIIRPQARHEIVFAISQSDAFQPPTTGARATRADRRERAKGARI